MNIKTINKAVVEWISYITSKRAPKNNMLKLIDKVD